MQWAFSSVTHMHVLCVTAAVQQSRQCTYTAGEQMYMRRKVQA